MADTSASPVSGEWVTLAEAAKRLRVSTRTAQRYAGKLPADAKRTTPTDGAPNGAFLVSLVAITAEAEKAKARYVASNGVELATDSATNGALSPTVDAPSPVVVEGQSTNGATTDAALVVQLQSEVTFLRAALEREQANVEKGQANIDALTSELSEARKQHGAELAEARRESQVMLGAVAAGRVQIGTADTTGDAEKSEPQKTPDVVNGSSAPPWWAFWKMRT